jgi:hypothetical protein
VQPLPAPPAKFKLFFRQGRLNLVATADMMIKAGTTMPVEFFSAEIALD